MMPNYRVPSILCAAALLAACGGSQVNSTIPLQPASQLPARPFASRGYQTLYAFQGGRNGASPNGSLVSLNGVLYGTTIDGGKRGDGTVFAVDTSGNERVIYTFKGGADGISPTDGLTVLGGVLYGTTIAGGDGCDIGPVGDTGCGTVFAVTTSGKERVVYRFKWGSDGAAPIVGLAVLHGALYGVTWVGGLKTVCANFLSKGCGTVFEVSTSGNERVLHRFKGRKDGALPEGRLLARDGELFGTANKGGNRGCGGAGCGTIFKVDAAGAAQVVYRFEGGSDGGNPSAGMISIGGALYGTTTQGGSGCEESGCGTIFKATTSGQETTLYRFKGPPDGLYPLSSLVAVSGKLYGVTFSGGTVCIPGSSGYDGGTAFEADTSGIESVLHRFKCRGSGRFPAGALLPLGGQLYGATTYGGRRGDGTLFALSF
jgi:uncharacterized repeat protein (TIGR03803 family)